MGKHTRAKEFLIQAEHINDDITCKLEQAASTRELAAKATAVLTGVKVSGTRNIHRMEDAIVKVMEMEDEIAEGIERLVELKREIARVIERVGNAPRRRVLTLRYLCFRRWDETADEMGYSIQHVHRLHGAALEDVEAILCRDRQR
jgi:DNA-directed RNA polymerase specialized sigma subunit